MFKRIWTGNALVVEETTDAVEPNYGMHQRDELISMVKTYSISMMLILIILMGIVSNWGIIVPFDILRIVLSLVGILVCAMLMEKQLFGVSHYGDKVCSLFHRAGCNSVLDGPMAKVFGISWSEVGLGYFMANILLLSLIPEASAFIAVINWVAMLYGVWSIYYQWRVAKSWCVLCLIAQAVIWAMGITAIISIFDSTFYFRHPLWIVVLYGLFHQYFDCTPICFGLCNRKRNVYVLCKSIGLLKPNSDVAKSTL